MRCFAALSLWLLGRPDEGLTRIEEALTLARELCEPHGLTHALFFAAILYQLCGEAAKVQQHAEEAIAVSRDYGSPMYEAMATIIGGWALIDQERHDEAIEQMRAGLDALRATGTELVRPYFLALLVEALAKARPPEEGLDVVEEALAATQRTAERFYEAELYRLKGELLLKQSIGRAVSQAEKRGKVVVKVAPVVINAKGCFNQSIKIARQQKAKSLELRAATSLAYLYQNQDKREKARRLLAQVYDSFAEGLDTADLREAKALLDELSKFRAKTSSAPG